MTTFEHVKKFLQHNDLIVYINNRHDVLSLTNGVVHTLEGHIISEEEFKNVMMLYNHFYKCEFPDGSTKWVTGEHLKPCIRVTKRDIIHNSPDVIHDGESIRLWNETNAIDRNLIGVPPPNFQWSHYMLLSHYGYDESSRSISPNDLFGIVDIYAIGAFGLLHIKNIDDFTLLCLSKPKLAKLFHGKLDTI